MQEGCWSAGRPLQYRQAIGVQEGRCSVGKPLWCRKLYGRDRSENEEIQGEYLLSEKVC